MNRVQLMPPLVEGQSVNFYWRVEPKSSLYRKTSFTLRFPACIDLTRVPSRLWWDVFLLCLHPHWLLLRPCQIHLPLKLPTSERQFWLQLLQNGADTLAANRSGQPHFEALNITLTGGELDIPRTQISGSGFGTSFSSGKDSLLQAALLCELTQSPLLVTTTSPLPPLADHDTERRRKVLSAIEQRRNVRVVEVLSDFRSVWDNGFAARLGYHVAVNELTDTFLYMSNLLLVGAALGYTRLFLASEAEVQASAVLYCRIVQHSHFMYSAATQRALAGLLSFYRIRFGSLIWPLYSIQVQQLLWARYPDLCDLQYSCWRVQPGEATCSQCEQCVRIALIALAGYHNPERMGIDLRKVLTHAGEWGPLANASRPAPVLPQEVEWRQVEARVIAIVRRISLRHLAHVLAGGRTGLIFSWDTLRRLRDFRNVQLRACNLPAQSRVGVREAFFDWLDPELKESLISIYTHYFPLEPRREHLDAYERSRALAVRATSLLD